MSDEPASVDPATIPGPYAANLGDGANGLSEAQVADLAQHLYDREGFHAADSWATETSINRGRYEALAEAVRDWLPSIVREHTERAWDEGYKSGHSNAMRRMSDEPNAPTTPNPYRKEQS